MVFRNFYHTFLLSIIVQKNSNSNSGKWLIVFNSEKNLGINTAVALVINKLVSRGWHHKIVFNGNTFFKNFSKDAMTKKISIGERSKINISSKEVTDSQWKINLEKKIAILNEINFYDIIDSSLSNFLKSYNLDYQITDNNMYFHKASKSINHILNFCLEIQKYLEKGKRITLILYDADRLPSAVVLKFFESKKLLDKLTIYSIGPGYGIYNDKGNWNSGNFMLTKSNPLYAHHYYAWYDDFTRWYKEKGKLEKDDINLFTNKILSSNHYIENNKIISKNKEDIIRNINLYKNQNKKIYCLFSHLFFDRPIKDETNYFSSMLDWIDKTIEVFRNDKNKVLLIKPHIVETFYPKEKRPKQKLENYLANVSFPDNIILLESDSFLADEIRGYIDTAIIWRSTAHVENICRNIPSLYCGPQSAYSSVIKSKIPNNLEEYIQQINKSPHIQYSNSEVETAKALIYFLNKIKTIPIDCFYKLPEVFGDNIIINPLKIRKLLKDNEYFMNQIESTILNNEYGASKYSY